MDEERDFELPPHLAWAWRHLKFYAVMATVIVVLTILRVSMDGPSTAQKLPAGWTIERIDDAAH